MLFHSSYIFKRWAAEPYECDQNTSAVISSLVGPIVTRSPRPTHGGGVRLTTEEPSNPRTSEDGTGAALFGGWEEEKGNPSVTPSEKKT